MATILIMIDGLRPDAVFQAAVPRLKELVQRSAYTFQARSVTPSVTLPCHMSIFHSTPPQRHGVVTNHWQPMARPLPGLMEQAKAAGRRSYFFHNWEPLRDLSRPEQLDFAYYRNCCYSRDGDYTIAQVAAETVVADRPDFAFVYLGTVDVAGHVYGWMSDDYLAQVDYVDGALGIVLDALDKEDTIHFLADHGGHERTHGTDAPEDMTIPWLIAGPGIRCGYELQTPVSLLDTAPTLAHTLDIPVAKEWEGQCIREAFEE